MLLPHAEIDQATLRNHTTLWQIWQEFTSLTFTAQQKHVWEGSNFDLSQKWSNRTRQWELQEWMYLKMLKIKQIFSWVNSFSKASKIYQKNVCTAFQDSALTKNREKIE